MILEPLSAPPAQAVTEGKFAFGRYGAPIASVNMLDVSRPYHYPVPLFAKKLRLKEWQAFQFGDSRWYFFTALYTAKITSMAIFYAYDRQARRRYGFCRNIPGQAFSFSPSLSKSRVEYKRSRVHFSIESALDEGRFDLDIARLVRDPELSFAGHFGFSYGPQVSAPLSVCLPLGLNRAMYSTKVLMPLEGDFKLGSQSFRLQGPDAMGVLDDHKAFYPFSMHYDWVSGFGTDEKGRRVGFNLTNNQVKDQVRYNENCLWVNNKIWSLPPVKVTRPEGVEGEWIIQDTEGMVDLVFIPECPNDVQFNLGLVACDYHGPFGKFRGVIKNGGGEKIDASLLFGAGERKRLRM